MTDNNGKETDMTAASITNINEFKAAVAGTEHLGDISWWNVRLKDNVIERGLWKSILEQHGVPLDHFPEEKSHAEALRDAIKQTPVGTRALEIKASLKADDRVCYVVRRNNADGAGNLDAVQECMISLAKDTGAISCNDAQHEIGQLIVAKYREIRSQHVTEDVQKFLLGTITKNLAGFALRDRGGFYFVPTTHRQRLADLREAVAKLGESRLGLIGVGRTVGGMSDNCSEAADAAQAHIEDELKALHDGLDSFIAEPTTREGRRITALEERLAEFEALRARAKMYRDVLNVEVVDLDSKIDALCKRAEDEIARKGDEREARRAAK